MGIWQKITSTVKGWLGGGRKKKKEPPQARAVSSNPRSRSQASSSNGTYFNRRELLNSLRSQEKEAERVKDAFKAKKVEYKDIANSSKTERQKGLEDTLNASKNKLKEIQDYAKENPQQKKRTPTPDPKIDAAKKSRAEMRKKLDAKKQENKEWHEVTNNRFNVGEKGISDEERKRRQQNVKSQTYDEKTAVKEAEHQMKWHGKEMSFARGALSGATFGASDLAAKKLTKGEARKAEEVYQQNKSKGWETAGEIAGSLASFGATAGATEKAAAKLTSKVAPKAAEKLAERQIIKNAAKRSFNKAVEKGLVSEATEELVKQVGKDKAKKVVTALGNDVVQNLTTGALYDINKASTAHEVGSDDWWKELGTSAAFNALITGGVAGGSMLTGGKQLVKDAARTVNARAGLRELAESRTGATQISPPRIGESIDNRIARVNAEAAERNADDVARTILAAEEPEATARAVAEAQEPRLRVTEDGREIAAAEPEANRQMTFDDVANAPEENKAAPKTKKQVKKERAEEQRLFNSLDGIRDTTKSADAKMREQTGGDYGVRQGMRTAAEHAPAEQAKSIKEESEAINKALDDGSIKEMFTDDNTPFGIFKTANKAERTKVAEAATARINEGTQKVANRLLEKAERLKQDLLNHSTLTSSEHVTLDDVADIVALRNRAQAAGIKLPQKYEDAFTHIIEWQRTEGAQMLKAVDLYLKENDRNYRKMLLSRDINNYLRKVLKADDSTIADIKRSLDANNGEGYFDNMIEELSKFKGDKNEAAFRKAYADFQAEIFMNTKPTVWDTVNLWRHTLMLSSPKTGANNYLGNVLQRTMYNISDAVNMAGESIAKGINKDVKRTTALLKTGDQRRLARMYTSGKRGEKNIKNAKYLAGFKDQEFADVINNVADADVGDMMASSKYMGEVVKGLKYKPTTVGGKIQQGINNAGGAISTKYVSTMLNEPDSWFVERNYRSALLKYLEANGVNSAESLKGNSKILKEARAYAKDVALENTYKKANNVVSFLEGIRRKGHTKGSNLGYKTGAIILDAELPYLKVPANLVVNNFKYSPLGAMKGGIDAFRAVVKGDANALNKATRELSKGLTGTGMAALGYMMFCDDQTDKDSWGFIGNAKDELKEYGVRDNSFKIGDKNFSISNMGIGSVQFLMGAALAEDLAEQGATPPHQVVLDALSKTVDTVAGMSLMENAVALLDTFGNGGDYNATVSQRIGNAATEVAGDYLAQFVPNPMRGVAKGLTDADLDTGVKKGETSKVQRVLERNRNNIIQGVPVLNEKTLPHKVDTHGNLVGERKTAEDKAKAVANNLLNPLSPKTVNIPKADIEELKVKDEDGNSFKPKGFDPQRTYQAKVGTGKNREVIDLTGKEREQVARAAKHSGHDGAMNLVKKGMFGDRLGDRAQQILKEIPDDEEKAREYIFATDEWKNSSNAEKEKWLKAWYGEGQPSKGVNRTRNAEAYINVAGNSEGDFRWQNDISTSYQDKYNDAGLAEAGIDKGTWVDILEACQDSNHKWKEDTKKNQDTINSAYKTKRGILSVEGLTPEQRIAAYQVIRGKRNGYGWYDWDGVSGGGYGGYRRGYRRGWRNYSRGGGKSKAPAIKQSAFKADKQTYKNIASTLKTRGSTSSIPDSVVKITPPKVKFKKYEV